ncbi:hypothetical protein HPULCUR_000126 [Helicostylum pulchrum]|uniref:Uncharacterized protein n=1 Tax=Helicostylum pulchrum TaxID=562976 RepID=A0ABP9XKQ1_9FUNG
MENLADEIKMLQAEKQIFENRLKDILKKEYPWKETKRLKSSWKKGSSAIEDKNNELLYRDTQVLKKRGSDLFKETQQLKSDMKAKRQALYIKRAAVKFGDRIRKNNWQRQQLSDVHLENTLRKQGCGLSHDYNTNLDPTTILDTDYVFSGTDNGIVSMTNTVGFDLTKFKFHLELSNRFTSLEDLKDDDINADDITDKYKDNFFKFTSESSY